MRKRIAVVALAALSLTGCVSTSKNVPETGRDTYTVSSTADGLRSAAAARESAYEAGQRKCASNGKRFQLVHESSERTRMGIDTTITVAFRCLRDEDPDYGRPVIRTAPTAVIEDRRR